MNFYATRAGTPARDSEEACARELGLQLRTLKPIEAAARGLLAKGKTMQQGNGDVSNFVERGLAAQMAVDRELERESEFVERLELRCTTADLARFKEAAERSGVTLSAWIRIVARGACHHPALEAGAFHGMALALAQRAVEGLERAHIEVGRVAAELHEMQMPKKKPAKKKPAKRLEMKYGNRKKKPARGGR